MDGNEKQEEISLLHSFENFNRNLVNLAKRSPVLLLGTGTGKNFLLKK